MSKSSIIWVLVVLVILIAGLSYAFMGDNNSADVMMEEKDDSMMQKEEDKMMEEGSMMEDGSAMEEEKMMKDEGDTMMMETGSYETYSPEKLSKADSGDVILFFRASWCPTCRALDSNLKANANNIPKGVTILDVDYDTYTTLKQKYGVTYQHTLVQVDSQGNQISKWSGSATLSDIVSKIQ